MCMGALVPAFLAPFLSNQARLAQWRCARALAHSHGLSRPLSPPAALKFAVEAAVPGCAIWFDQDAKDKTEAGMMVRRCRGRTSCRAGGTCGRTWRDPPGMQAPC